MKHSGYGSSLNPARELARRLERNNPPVAGTPAPAPTTLTGSAAPRALAVGDWQLGTDDDGNLTASYRGGAPRVIARRDDEEEGQA